MPSARADPECGREDMAVPRWCPRAGRYQLRCERYAEERGWVGPWGWDGVDIDDPRAAPLPDMVIEVDPVAVAGRSPQRSTTRASCWGSWAARRRRWPSATRCWVAMATTPRCASRSRRR